MNQAQRRLLARWKQRQATLSGTYADYVYQGEELFLQAAANGINSLARGHGKARVVRQGGRQPFLVYEGEDMNDISFEMVLHVWSAGTADVFLGWSVNSAYSGKSDGKVPYKWGMLKPEDLVLMWRSRAGVR